MVKKLALNGMWEQLKPALVRKLLLFLWIQSSVTYILQDLQTKENI
jgi:hypothetical protein